MSTVNNYPEKSFYEWKPKLTAYQYLQSFSSEFFKEINQVVAAGGVLTKSEENTIYSLPIHFMTTFFSKATDEGDASEGINILRRFIEDNAPYMQQLYSVFYNGDAIENYRLALIYVRGKELSWYK